MISRRELSLPFFLFVLVVGFVLSFFQKPAIPSATTSAATSSMVAMHSEGATSTVPIVLWSASVSSTAQIVRVVDGDTVDAIPDGEEKAVRIRLLGINTPESVDPRRPVECFGKEASHGVQSMVLHRRVALVADPEADDRDKYNRLLRILVLEDGTDINATLVAQGYAHAYVGFPMKKERKSQLRSLEGEARAAERGLWSPATCNGEKTIK